MKHTHTQLHTDKFNSNNLETRIKHSFVNVILWYVFWDRHLSTSTDSVMCVPTSQPNLLTQTDTAGWIKAHSERLCDKCELYEIGIWTVIYETFILLYLNIWIESKIVFLRLNPDSWHNCPASQKLNITILETRPTWPPLEPPQHYCTLLLVSMFSLLYYMIWMNWALTARWYIIIK